MVIKYDTCSYSGYKIAPGHGLRYCEVNGKSHVFINKKQNNNKNITNNKSSQNLNNIELSQSTSTIKKIIDYFFMEKNH